MCPPSSAANKNTNARNVIFPLTDKYTNEKIKYTNEKKVMCKNKIRGKAPG